MQTDFPSRFSQGASDLAVFSHGHSRPRILVLFRKLLPAVVGCPFGFVLPSAVLGRRKVFLGADHRGAARGQGGVAGHGLGLANTRGAPSWALHLVRGDVPGHAARARRAPHACHGDLGDLPGLLLERCEFGGALARLRLLGKLWCAWRKVSLSWVCCAFSVGMLGVRPRVYSPAAQDPLEPSHEFPHFFVVCVERRVVGLFRRRGNLEGEVREKEQK